MSDILEIHFLEFHKVVRWHTSGDVDKFTTIWCSDSSGLHIPKIIEIGPRLTGYSKKHKLFDTVAIKYSSSTPAIVRGYLETLWDKNQTLP